MIQETLVAKAEHARNYQLTTFLGRGTRTAESDGFQCAYLKMRTHQHVKHSKDV